MNVTAVAISTGVYIIIGPLVSVKFDRKFVTTFVCSCDISKTTLPVIKQMIAKVPK